MLDSFGRKVDYVRISVTDRCDLRCKYCMPKSNPHFFGKKEILSLKKLQIISEALINLGIRKIRITGGEPLIRKDIIEYIKFLSHQKKNKKIDEILLTTNGTMLEKYAEQLNNYRIERVNVSLDSLVKEKFQFITNGGNLNKVVNGIFKAKKNNISVKINTVLLKNFNEDEIIKIVEWCSKNSFTLSFIEVMPVGDISSTRTNQFLPISEAKKIIRKKFKLEKTNLKSSGPSNYFFCKQLNSYIGFISPISDHFCETCNRIRVTSNGKIYPCLGDNNSVDLNKYLDENNTEMLSNVIKKVIYKKPERHYFKINEKSYIKDRFMNSTGG